jgi:hypothetical protein
MEQDHARLAAERFGTVSGLRAEAARAIADGEYRIAIGFTMEALSLSHDALSQLDLSAPEVRPHQALASAVLSDLDAARAWVVEPVEPSAHVVAVEAEVRDLVSPWTTGSGPTNCPYKCPHGRASYDGNCMSIPPCPAS